MMENDIAVLIVDDGSMSGAMPSLTRMADLSPAQMVGYVIRVTESGIRQTSVTLQCQTSATFA